MQNKNKIFKDEIKKFNKSMPRKNVLKFYFSKLGVAMIEEEFEEHVKQLNTKEIDALIALCEEQLAYEDAIDEEARKLDPEKFDREQKEFRQKLLQIELDHIDDMEKIQEKYDTEMDKVEDEYKRKVMKDFKEREKLVDELEGVVKDVKKELKETSNDKGQSSNK